MSGVSVTSPSPIWYLGPAEDMRAIVCPETDMDISVTRYGGMFQGLSGARSMTTTGHKQAFALTLKYLTPDEHAWLEALHLRTVPGPYRLLNPFKRNLLSPQSSLFRTVGDTRHTELSNGVSREVRDWPTQAGVYGALGMTWTNRTVNPSVLRFDTRYKVPVTPGVPVTGSFYVKGSATGSVILRLDWYDSVFNQILPSGSATIPVTTAWQRMILSGTPPGGASLVHFAVIAEQAPDLTFAAAQLETGAEATAWEVGGGAPVVLLDQMPTTSHMFPFRSVSLSLLEA